MSNPALPTLLVTGGSGRLGTAVLNRARAEPANEHFNVVSLSRATGVNICDESAVRDAVARHPDAHALIHTAGFTDVTAAHAQRGDQSSECYQANVVGTANVARACALQNLAMIHVSSTFVFSGNSKDPYTETDEPCPIEWYGETKLLAEALARSVANASIVRFAHPYFARRAESEASQGPDLVQFIRDQLQGGRTASLFDDQVITPVSGEDVASGLVLLASVQQRGSLFHLAGPESVTPYDLGQRIATLLGHDPTQITRSSLSDFMERDPRPRQRVLRADAQRWIEYAKSHGLAAPRELDAGLREVLCVPQTP